MGSQGNKFSDDTAGLQPSERKLCANGCGFFGSASTMNLCSKCFRDLRIHEGQAASAKAAMDKLVDGLSTDFHVSSSSKLEAEAEAEAEEDSPVVLPPPAAARVVEPVGRAANRCNSCNKKVGVVGFKCRCGDTFCGAHRYPEKHECSFDFKATGRDAIAKANPVVKADKVVRF